MAATEAGASVDGGGATPLHTAARYFRAEFARNCCNTLSELIAFRPLALEEKDKKGRLPLHVLARYHGAQVLSFFFCCRSTCSRGTLARWCSICLLY